MEQIKSTLSRALIFDGQVSLAVIDSTALSREAQKRHSLKGDSLRVLAKTLTAACYLSGWLKGENSSLTIALASDGDFGKVSVLCDGNLNLRGYVQNKDVVNGRLGGGFLTVVRDDGEGLPFSGSVPLVSEEIGENFVAYFRESEQLQTGIALSVVLEHDEPVHAGGVFLQALPFAGEKALRFIENETESLKRYLDSGEYERIFSVLGAEKAETREARFSCRCSKERVESLILSMGEEGAGALLKEQGQISVHCEYCNADYVFRKEQIRELFKRYGR